MKMEKNKLCQVLKTWNYRNLPNDIITGRLLDDGTLVLNGHGTIPSTTNAPWQEYSNLIVKIITMWGITRIDDNAFLGYQNLREVELSNSVRHIGSNAFANTINLRYVDMPLYLESIETKAFADSGIEEVYVPELVTNISKSAFQNCRYLKTVEFSKNCKLKTIDCDTFDNCNILQNVTLHSKLEVIDSRAFARCPFLRTITIPKGMVDIGAFAFNKSGLEEVTFLGNPNDIRIDDNAFGKCAIKKVEIKAKNIFELNIDSYKISPYKGAFKDTPWLNSLAVQEPEYHILHIFDTTPPRLVLRMKNICYLLKNYHSKRKFEYYRFNEREYECLTTLQEYHKKAERYFREFNSVLNNNRSFYNTIRTKYDDLLKLVIACVESKHSDKKTKELASAMFELDRLKKSEENY